MKKIALALSLIMLTVLSSCKKDDSQTPKTKSDILVASTWQIDEVIVTGGTVYPVGQLYKKGIAGQNDFSKVRLTFRADGTATAIDNSGNSSTSGKWALTNGDTKLVISDTGNFLLDGNGDIVLIDTGTFNFKGSRSLSGKSVDATVKMIPAQ
ncbi:hypothetical protein SAMN04515674_102414 [Pseudarcicella hirudinis]|uniref:Lipocalin-like domain-containing protein n=1 Tax=Pseudarcicella hirudinis TaxID=1079859 RepID=A0A1I5PD15_9BACT|nr:lipocalin family protein [Pseudarcicella hirudinis]SFP31935.1 hypothetical protein SAMN04515674_102414 [Pseudarcicella hirudinis]